MELSEKLNAELIGADATSVEDLENLLKKSTEILGGKLILSFIQLVCL